MNLNKKDPYTILEKDIYSIINEGSILLLGDFNARNTTNQAIILKVMILTLILYG